MSNSLNSNTPTSKIYEQLKVREKQWRQARQRLIALKERQMFWFGDNSLMMWLLWQLVSYVAVAILLMLLSKMFDIQLSLWQYSFIFALQAVIFLIMLASKGKLANKLQNSIDKTDMEREQALSEMISLATDCIFPNIHANAPISLQHIHQCYGSQLRLSSLQYMLQKEIEAGRLILGEQQTQTQMLIPEFAEDELPSYADKMIYKSLVGSYSFDKAEISL